MRTIITQFGRGTASNECFVRCGGKNTEDALPLEVTVKIVGVDDPYYKQAMKYPNGHLVYINPYHDL